MKNYIENVNIRKLQRGNENTLERHDGIARRARTIIDHATFNLFLAERCAVSLLISVPHEDVLEGILVGARAAHHRGDV